MTKTILIADTDSGVREQLKWCLRSAGYHVVTAQNRFETMAALVSRRIDLLLLDTAMAGPESSLVMRIPILMLAQSADEVPKEFAGLVKPIAPRELLEIVSGVVGSPGGSLTPWPVAMPDQSDDKEI